MIGIRILICSVLGLGTIFSSCQNGNYKASITEQKSKSSSENQNFLEFESPSNGCQIRLKENVLFNLKKLKDSFQFDSIQLIIDGINATTLLPNNIKFNWNTENSRLGKIQAGALVYSKGEVLQNLQTIIFILSDTKPVEYTYKIIKTYPHSRNAYTQGLIFEDGYFYESVGEYGKSALRKVKLETGQATQTVNHEATIFAEGLAQYKDKLYQISYREQTGFVYDKKTFKLERKFNFDLSEGWGLEFNGQYFLATDGSSFIYFMEPEYFTQKGYIQVVDDQGSIQNINELELIKGQLFANVYTKNIVLIIDPKTGKVLGKIDFTGLLPQTEIDETTDVLNGIAWNPQNGHLYITGKNWPKLFEVIIEKK
jgi:glutamine cyclotransferase